MQNNRLIALFIPLLFLLSCSRPSVSQSFVTASQRDSLGRYAFTLPMDDSAAFYNISFYTRLDLNEDSFSNLTDIEISVLMQGPDSTLYSETVYMPKQKFSRKTAFTIDYDLPYRIASQPVACGQWQLLLTTPDIQGLRGMGVRLEKM